ncbi:MAG: hypothetical protein Q4B09_09695 [Lachnospiraceae bacterium]|nr:hypothetical protein [Lachnospiraceae bacterium]
MKRNESYLQNAVKELKQEAKRVRLGAYVMIALLVGVLALSFLKNYMLTLGALAVVLFLQIFVFKRQQKRYKNHLQQANLLAGIGALLRTEELDEKGGAGLSAETVRAAELLPFHDKGNAVNFYLGMSGSYEKLKVTVADASIAEYFSGSKNRAMVNCGNWTHIELPYDTGMNWRLLDTETVPEAMRREFFGQLPGMQKIAAEDWKLPEGMLVYGTEPEGKRPSDAFVAQLRKLKVYTPGKLAVSIHGNQADVYVRNRFLGSRYRANTEPTEELLEKVSYPELEKILKLIMLL